MTTHERETPDRSDDEDILHIGQVMTRWRLLVGRRLIGRLAIGNVAPDLELSHLDVLDAIRRLQASEEVTVGSVAEILRIHPSRASRIIAEMVAKGVLRRKASQQDARRIIVVITALGQRLIAEIQTQKLSVVKDIVVDWPATDVRRFATLFDRFASGYEQRFKSRKDVQQD
ncbi:MAG: MarR family winged helix-turn-helix transcriptional regulator [Phyllobacterium sp.]